MKIRVTGTPDEVATVVEALRYAERAEKLTVADVSQPYPNRGGSGLVRVYVEARMPQEVTGR